MTKLLVITGADRGKKFELLEHDLVSIGRDPRNGIHINDAEVSRLHATIKKTDSGFVVRDRDSSNGTFVNECRIGRHTLESRDMIRVGKTTMVFDSSPVSSMVNVEEMVHIASGPHSDDDPPSSKIVKSISARVTPPVEDDDNQTTDSFLEHLEDNIGVIYRTAMATSRITRIDELHQKVLELIFDWVKADRGCVILMDSDLETVKPVAFRQSSHLPHTGRMDINRNVLRYVQKRNESVLTQDVENDIRWRTEDDGSGVKRPGYLEAMCAPMNGRMGTVGFVYVDRFVAATTRRGKRKVFEPYFSTPQLKILLAVAHQAGLATENANYYTTMTRNAQLVAVGEAFTQIAHHMRNMLQGLEASKNRIDHGIKHQDWSQVSDGWKVIDPLTTRMFNLAVNLLSVSVDREPRMVRESLNDTVSDVIATVEKSANQHGIKIDWEANLKLKPIYFDPESIYRALLNVVQNAIDACDLGCVIKIRLVEQDDRINISVIDDGEGIDPKKIDLIFTRFASTKGELGTGIGLYVTRKIMHEHAGGVEVSSNLGNGSKFVLWMPIRRDREQPNRLVAEDTSMYDTHD